MWTWYYVSSFHQWELNSADDTDNLKSQWLQPYDTNKNFISFSQEAWREAFWGWRKGPNSFSFDDFPLNVPPFLAPDCLVTTQVVTTISAFQMARGRGGICRPIRVLSGVAQDTPGGTYLPEFRRMNVPSCEWGWENTCPIENQTSNHKKEGDGGYRPSPAVCDLFSDLCKNAPCLRATWLWTLVKPFLSGLHCFWPLSLVFRGHGSHNKLTMREHLKADNSLLLPTFPTAELFYNFFLPRLYHSLPKVTFSLAKH